MTATATSTFVATEPLTREHIKAMRNADSAVLRWEQFTAPEDASGYARRTIEGHITVSKEVERGDGFGRDTLRVDIPSRVLVCRPLGWGPLVLEGEPVLAWRHLASGRRVFTCPDIPGFGWKIEGDSSESFSSSLRAVVGRLERRLATTSQGDAHAS